MLRINLPVVCLAAFSFNLVAYDGATGTPAAGADSSNDAVSAQEVDQLRQKIAQQEKKLRELRKSLADQRQMLNAAVETLAAAPTPVPPPQLVAVASSSSRTVPTIAAVSHTGQPSPPVNDAPLSLRIGNGYITPAGFVDLTFVTRSTNLGGGNGTNYGAIPFSNTATGQLHDLQLSAQSTRPVVRFDTLFKETKVLAYFEGDFLGNSPTNVLVSSNSATFRVRLAFADLQRGGWEITAGQTWTMLTPNRTGISPLPEDVFVGRLVDPNPNVGTPWARQAGFRIAYHAGEKLHFAVALENPQQYIGGSAGGGTSVLPSNLPATIASQVNSGAANFGTPATMPDIIAKVAFDPGVVHSELAGIVVAAKTYNSATPSSHTTTGGGISFNNSIGAGKHLRFFENGLYGRGIGRYLYGQGPSLVINSDGRPSNVLAASGLLGLEAQVTKKLLAYGYFGSYYFGRSEVWDPTAKKFVGYGYTGSANSQNRLIDELSVGLRHTFWSDPRYGNLAFNLQYAYVLRDPWYVAAAAPGHAHSNILFLSLRYFLPGQPPKLK